MGSSSSKTGSRAGNGGNRPNPMRRSPSSSMKRSPSSKNGMYKCEFCPVTVKRRHDLKKHRDVVHMGLKKYVCTTCGDRFGHNGTLQKHYKNIHLGLKPYKCERPGCGKKFSEKGNLNKHKRTCQF